MSPSNIKSTTIKWNPIEGKKFLVLETLLFTKWYIYYLYIEGHRNSKISGEAKKFLG